MNNPARPDSNTDADGPFAAHARFLRGLSHELRTPLGSILILTELLGDSDLPQAAAGKIEKIRQAAGDLQGIIEQVSTLAKTTDGRLIPTISPIDPRAVVDDLHAEYSERAQKKGLAFEAACDASLPSALHTDRQILRGALTHLLDHALDATHEGRVALAVTNGSAGGEIAWTVADTGRGIPEALRPSIFEAFPAESFVIRRSYGASPLSLPLAKALSELLGARLTLDSEEGRGTTVRLLVPSAAT